MSLPKNLAVQAFLALSVATSLAQSATQPAAVPQTTAAADSSLATVAPPMTLGLAPGDQIDVRYIDLPEAADVHHIINADGTIRVPYAGLVNLAGLMPKQAEQAIIDALEKKQVVQDPQVILTVLNARYMLTLVMGQVRAPQAVQLYAPTRLGQLLAQTGGFSTQASYTVHILHYADASQESIPVDPMSLNFNGMNQLIYPGDVINVSQAQNFYVMGNVSKPGAYPLVGKKEITLFNALTMAGGTASMARLSHCRLLRTENGHREETIIDIAKLQRGEVPDPIIHPNDIIYVPSSWVRAVTNNWFGSAISSLTLYTYLHNN